ncbi:MAG: T9SS type A sorting domain-containing protein [Fluviicola sp.]|nr:T9SS type A sorting domain-containing protein [Fluviicola sp.]
MRKLLLTSLLLFMVTNFWSQTPLNCQQTPPKEHVLKQMRQLQEENAKSTEIKVFPIVFHVLHEFGSENIADAQIQDALLWLNKDFQAMNPDIVDVIPPFDTIIGTTNFEFRLATIDPQGNPTNGIDRIFTSLTNNANDASKINTWDPAKYINVWVVKSIEEDGISGFTDNPFNSDSLCNPGIVMINDYVGTIGTGFSAVKHFLSHEMGHYFGLFHLTENVGVPQGNNDCAYSDGIFDTPHQTSLYACFQGFNTCNDSLYLESLNYWGYDAPDNEENFLAVNYCSRMFTKQQSVLMRSVAESPLYGRDQLWTEANLIATGTLDSTTFLPIASAEFLPQLRTVCVNDSVRLLPEMSNNTAQYSWVFPGGSPSSSNLVSPKVAYANPGFYDISLTVTTPTGTDNFTFQNAVYVAGNWPDFVGPTLQDFDTLPIWWIPQSSLDNFNYFELLSTNGTNNSGCYRLHNPLVEELGCPTIDQLTSKKDYLISPAFDLTNTSNVSVSFDYAFGTDETTSGSIAEKLIVYTSRDCGKTWMQRKQVTDTALVTAFATVGSDFEPTANQWKTATFNYTTNALDSKTRFRFEFQASNHSNHLYLDNFRIDGVLSLTDLESANVVIAPNPIQSGEVLHVQTSNESASIQFDLFDLSGKLVHSVVQTANNTTSWNIPIPVKAGLYIARIQQGNTMFTQKICVE